MSKSHGESSHSRASESPALNPASSDRNLTPTDDAKEPISEVQFCSSAVIFNPKIEKAYRNETNLPPRLATPLRLVTLPEDQPITQSKPGRARNTSNPRKPVEGSNMGNIFGSKKKKKKNAQKEDDEEIWKKMGANESSTSLPHDAKKKDKKKKDKKSKRVESPSPPRGGDGSLKGKDPKRYAMYEPQSNSKDPQTHAVRSRTLPARVDPSEFRKSIGDPMDFRMADDVSPAGSPGHATPETATPPVQKSPGPIYKKINVNREKKTNDRSIPNTPKMNHKNPAAQPVDSKTGKVAEMKKQHSVPTPGTGSPRPRGYILPSPPSRPKFYSTEPGSASPKLLRVQPQKPVTLNSSSDDSSYSNKDKLAAVRANSKPRNIPRLDLVKNNNRKDVHGIHQEGLQVVQQKRSEAFDIAMQKENEENERNLKREERRKMAAVADMQTAPKLEECQKIKETVVEAVESRITESEKHEVTSGPKVAILSTIPPPEKAVLSHVPPPSPSAMDALCEENEDDDMGDENVDDDDDSDNHVTYRRSKEVEEFGGIVCQRLSQLLESQDDGTLKLQFIESSGPSSSLSPASPGMVMSGGSDLDRERMEDAGLGYSSMSPPMETENVYKEKSIPKKLLCVEMTKPSTFSQRLERSSISTRSTQGSNSASDLDGRVNYRDSKSPRSRDFIRDRRENESEISSSEEESSYTSDSEYSSRGYDEKRDHVTSYRENEYSIPWDLHRFPRSASYTSDGLDMSDSDLFYEHEIRNKPENAQIAHVQRNARHGRKMREQDISDCDDMSDSRWCEYPQEKYQKDSRLNKSRQVSVEELRIEPVSVKRQLFALPKQLCENDDRNEIEEPEIKPSFVNASENTSSHIPKRGSEMMSDVIDAYTSEDMAVTKRNAPIVPPKRQSTLSEEIIIEQPSNPSALDKSLKKIFSQEQEIEERYPELAPLHSLILGVEEGGTPSVEPFFEFRPGQLPTFTRVPFGSRRSLAYSESDLDMSEQRDDVSSDNMDADDEDDEEGGIVMLDRRDLEDEEVVYGRTYGDVNRRMEIKRSRVIIEREASEGEDSVFI